MDSQEFDVNFPETHWTQIGRAAEDHPEALERVLRLYQPVLRYHLEKRGVRREDAEDLVQELGAKLVVKNILQNASPEKGKFRTLLLTIVHRMQYDLQDKQCVRRAEPLDSQNPPVIKRSDRDHFDRAWAQTMLHEALRRMRDDCANRNQEPIWNVFVERLVQPLVTGSAPTSFEYFVTLGQFGSVKQARNALVTARRKFSKSLWKVVSEYAPEADIASEIDELSRILRSSPAMLVDEREFAELIDADEDSLLENQESELLSWGSSIIAPSNDLADLWERQLFAPLNLFLLETLDDWMPISTTDSIADVLHKSEADVETLICLKRAGRRHAKRSEEPTAERFGTVLYFAAIAAAQVRRGQIISKTPTAELLIEFRRLLEWNWLDDATRVTFEAVIGQLQVAP